MRKIIITAAVVALTFSASAFADEYVKGGFEASGHVNAGFGYQQTKLGTTVPAISTAAFNGDAGAGYGVLGEIVDPVTGVAAALGKNDNFAFFVQEVELDLMKTLGENIRVRADLDFGTGNSTTAAGVEQAYVTTNVAMGNGGEFLVGKFNAPIGFESVDVNENSTFSRSAIYRYLRPHNMTGAKFFYPWSDSFDWHFYIVNSLNDAVAGGASYVPSVGTRLGFNWGDDAQPSTFGVSLAAGPEATGGADKWGELSYLGDVDWNWWATEAFAFGGEAIFRMDNAITTGKDGVAFGGLLNANYAFSDVWDGTLKYAYVNRLGNGRIGSVGDPFGLTGTGVGRNFQSHELSLAAQYHITDGAKVQAEGKFDYLKSKASTKTYNYGAALNFAYDF